MGKVKNLTDFDVLVNNIESSISVKFALCRKMLMWDKILIIV